MVENTCRLQSSLSPTRTRLIPGSFRCDDPGAKSAVSLLVEVDLYSARHSQ